jgi:hypothetical protein
VARHRRHRSGGGADGVHRQPVFRRGLGARAAAGAGRRDRSAVAARRRSEPAAQHRLLRRRCGGRTGCGSARLGARRPRPRRPRGRGGGGRGRRPAAAPAAVGV